jgi:hypothetical protein
MDPKVADATYSFALAKHLAGQRVSLRVSDVDKGCGYEAPVINDIRSE